jgi:hypothetical protein
MEIIMIFYVIVFSYFPHRVLGVLAQTFNIQIFRFFSTEFFLKIVFILYDIQVLKGECCNTKYNVITWT